MRWHRAAGSCSAAVISRYSIPVVGGRAERVLRFRLGMGMPAEPPRPGVAVCPAVPADLDDGQAEGDQGCARPSGRQRGPGFIDLALKG